MSGIETLRAMALEFHDVLLTPAAAHALIPVTRKKREQLCARLIQEVSSLRSGGDLSTLCRQLEQQEFLSAETVQSLRSELSSVLLSLLARLRLSDVRPEVLASWLAETETSNSSSLGVDTSASELPTPARTDDDGMVTIRLPSAMLSRIFPVEGQG